MDKKHERILNILSKASGHPLDIYKTLVDEHLSKSAAPGEVLKTIIQYSKEVGSADEAPRLMAENDAKKLVAPYRSLIADIIVILMKDNPPDNIFYQRLYEYIFCSELIPVSSEMHAVILYMLAKPGMYMPYYQATDLLAMSDEEYKNRITQMLPKLHKAIHMLNRGFDSWTEQFSQIWQIEHSFEDEKDQIVFLSAFFSSIIAGKEKEE